MTAREILTYSIRGGASSSLTQLFWYALLACTVWIFFHVIFRHLFRHRRIGEPQTKFRQPAREFAHSIRSIIVFGVVAVVIVYAAILGWTRLYYRIGDYGWGWFVGSIAVMIVVHDTYFYWTHRMMHHRWLYRTFHHTHHLSTSPTPWAAYAFSPAEALVQAGIGPLTAPDSIVKS